MEQTTPEEKLLNLIRKDRSQKGLGKDVKIFTKINIALIAIVVIISAVFLADVFIFKEKLPEVPKMDTQINETEVKPVTNDSEENIADVSAINREIKSISKEEILGNLNLLGIITGNNNQAIIEDKALKKTFFLYKGDRFGELKVDEIKDNLVILDYKGEKIELHM